MAIKDANEDRDGNLVVRAGYQGETSGNVCFPEIAPGNLAILVSTDNGRFHAIHLGKSETTRIAEINSALDQLNNNNSGIGNPEVYVIGDVKSYGIKGFNKKEDIEREIKARVNSSANINFASKLEKSFGSLNIFVQKENNDVKVTWNLADQYPLINDTFPNFGKLPTLDLKIDKKNTLSLKKLTRAAQIFSGRNTPPETTKPVISDPIQTPPLTPPADETFEKQLGGSPSRDGTLVNPSRYSTKSSSSAKQISPNSTLSSRRGPEDKRKGYIGVGEFGGLFTEPQDINELTPPNSKSSSPSASRQSSRRPSTNIDSGGPSQGSSRSGTLYSEPSIYGIGSNKEAMQSTASLNSTKSKSRILRRMQSALSLKKDKGKEDPEMSLPERSMTDPQKVSTKSSMSSLRKLFKADTSVPVPELDREQIKRIEDEEYKKALIELKEQFKAGVTQLRKVLDDKELILGVLKNSPDPLDTLGGMVEHNQKGSLRYLTTGLRSFETFGEEPMLSLSLSTVRLTEQQKTDIKKKIEEFNKFKEFAKEKLSMPLGKEGNVLRHWGTHRQDSTTDGPPNVYEGKLPDGTEEKFEQLFASVKELTTAAEISLTMFETGTQDRLEKQLRETFKDIPPETRFAPLTLARGSTPTQLSKTLSLPNQKRIIDLLSKESFTQEDWTNLKKMATGSEPLRTLTTGLNNIVAISRMENIEALPENLQSLIKLSNDLLQSPMGKFPLSSIGDDAILKKQQAIETWKKLSDEDLIKKLTYAELENKPFELGKLTEELEEAPERAPEISRRIDALKAGEEIFDIINTKALTYKSEEISSNDQVILSTGDKKLLAKKRRDEAKEDYKNLLEMARRDPAAAVKTFRETMDEVSLDRRIVRNVIEKVMEVLPDVVKAFEASFPKNWHKPDIKVQQFPDNSYDLNRVAKTIDEIKAISLGQQPQSAVELSPRRRLNSLNTPHVATRRKAIVDSEMMTDLDKLLTNQKLSRQRLLGMIDPSNGTEKLNPVDSKTLEIINRLNNQDIVHLESMIKNENLNKFRLEEWSSSEKVHTSGDILPEVSSEIDDHNTLRSEDILLYKPDNSRGRVSLEDKPLLYTLSRANAEQEFGYVKPEISSKTKVSYQASEQSTGLSRSNSNVAGQSEGTRNKSKGSSR